MSCLCFFNVSLRSNHACNLSSVRFDRVRMIATLFLLCCMLHVTCELYQNVIFHPINSRGSSIVAGTFKKAPVGEGEGKGFVERFQRCTWRTVFMQQTCTQKMNTESPNWNTSSIVYRFSLHQAAGIAILLTIPWRSMKVHLTTSPNTDFQVRFDVLQLERLHMLVAMLFWKGRWLSIHKYQQRICWHRSVQSNCGP